MGRLVKEEMEEGIPDARKVLVIQFVVCHHREEEDVTGCKTRKERLLARYFGFRTDNLPKTAGSTSQQVKSSVLPAIRVVK
jgi:hypothetical protein